MVYLPTCSSSLKFMVNLGKYTRHGSGGIYKYRLPTPPPPAGGPLARCQLPKTVKNARLMLEPAVVFQTRFHLNLLGRIVWRRHSMKYVIMNIDIYVV